MPQPDRDLRFRESYRSIPLYAPGVASCAIDLSDNTNLWGPPPAARRTLAEPGDAIAHPAPSFSMIPTFARMSGVEPVAVPLRGDTWDVDAGALLATEARIIYLCSPNNPTGTIASREAVLEVVERAPGFVILDEAYAEFADEAYVARAPAWERVLVTRTMSKAFGLAGLRFGYGAGSAALVREVEKARGPYTVSAPAERAAEAA